MTKKILKLFITISIFYSIILGKNPVDLQVEPLIISQGKPQQSPKINNKSSKSSKLLNIGSCIGGYFLFYPSKKNFFNNNKSLDNHKKSINNQTIINEKLLNNNFSTEPINFISQSLSSHINVTPNEISDLNSNDDYSIENINENMNQSSMANYNNLLMIDGEIFLNNSNVVNHNTSDYNTTILNVLIYTINNNSLNHRNDNYLSSLLSCMMIIKNLIHWNEISENHWVTIKILFNICLIKIHKFFKNSCKSHPPHKLKRKHFSQLTQQIKKVYINYNYQIHYYVQNPQLTQWLVVNFLVDNQEIFPITKKIAYKKNLLGNPSYTIVSDDYFTSMNLNDHGSKYYFLFLNESIDLSKNLDNYKIIAVTWTNNQWKIIQGINLDYYKFSNTIKSFFVKSLHKNNQYIIE